MLVVSLESGDPVFSLSETSWAAPLERYGLTLLALLLLELARPWQIVAGQLLLMAEPLCGPEGRGALRYRAELLSSGSALDRLAGILEHSLHSSNREAP
jgi:hypothetical protein